MGVYLKVGNCCNSFPFLKDTFACALAAVSLVTSGLIPVSRYFIASNRQMRPAKNGVTFLCAGCLLKQLEIIANTSLKGIFTAFRTYRCADISLSINNCIALTTSSTSTKPVIPSVYQGNSLYTDLKIWAEPAFQSPTPNMIVGFTITACK